MITRSLLSLLILALCGADAMAEATLSNAHGGLAAGTWVAEEACGENKAAKDAEGRRPFSWEVDLAVKDGRVSGTKHFVNPTGNVVTDVSYKGTISGSNIEIEGVGKRSNLERPWFYSYKGEVSATGRLELSGPLTMQLSASKRSTTLRSCKLTFLAPKSDDLPSTMFARNVGDMRMVRSAMVAGFAKECDAAGVGKAKATATPGDDTRACVVDKLRVGLSKAVSAPWPSAPALELTEYAPSLIKPNKGPASAKGVIYFVGGYGVHENDQRIVPYYLKRLTDDGWDLIATRIPNANIDDTWEADGYQLPGGVSSVQRRLKEIKALGYKRIVLAGFSWGGWVSLVAAQTPDLPIDMLLVSAPAVFGHKIYDGKPNPFFDINLTAYKSVMAKAKVPAVLIFPDDPVGEPDAKMRGAIADIYLTNAGRPHRIIAAPAGFRAHYAAWVPFFDYAYGECIAGFLDQPKTSICPYKPISNTDFRSVLNLSQVPDEKSKRVASAQSLAGEKFVAYTLQDEDFKHFDFVSGSKRMTSVWNRRFEEPIAFRNDEFCAGRSCDILLRWSDDTLLEFDKTRGSLKAWWFLDK
ncbi:alpha/beta fold hydrolase [Mesorhizobium sp.]|uniref:alpha/beta fold hydrolase n=1 Tax=Mesorhizobium sp. TaxID=1871066 RepID=UPI0025CEA0CB|nr:alpha/beta fold hydrolase [Mesorhizobium sp.]